MVLNQPLLVSKNNEAVLYRLGSISIEEIERIGTIQIRNNKESCLECCHDIMLQRQKQYLLMMLN
jgi:hypothetical protein